MLLTPTNGRAGTLFDWWKSRKPPTGKFDGKAHGGGFGPHLILDELRSRVPRYLDDVDQGKLIYPACKRALSDPDGDVRSVWDHTRLEAMRYLMMVPGSQFELLTNAERQIEIMNAYLFQRPHDETVIEFTGVAPTDFAIAILAGLNGLTHCVKLSGVDPSQQSGTIRNFRKIVTLAHTWWLTDGAIEYSKQLLVDGKQPPLVLLSLVRLYATRKARRCRYGLWIVNQPGGKIGCPTCRSHSSF